MMIVLERIGPYTIRKPYNVQALEIYREGLTHATRCATIAYCEYQEGMRAAYAEIQRRLNCPKEQERVRFA